MKRKELQELLTLVKASGNEDAIAKLEDLIAKSSTATAITSWEKAVELAAQNRLTISRGNYDEAAEYLVKFTPESERDEVLKILSKKISGGNNE